MKRVFAVCVVLLLAACSSERRYSMEEPPPSSSAMPWETQHQKPSAPPAHRSAVVTTHTLPNFGSAGPLKTAMIGGYMDAQERDFRIHLRADGVGIYRIGDDIVLSAQNTVLFSSGMDLSARGQDVLERLAELLRHYDHSAVQVNGYTDTTGTPAQNLEASQKRAMVIANALVSDGVAGPRVSALGFGATKLKIATGPNVSEPRNRRIEIRVIARPVG
jgi:outer membrane protein OmpA-like peptidoglycan-associated protein